MLLKFLIVCPMVFIAGIVDAIAGGGGLITLPAYLIAGLPPHSAIATNKLSSSMGSTVATLRYALLGYIPWKSALICVPFGICGSYLGAKLSLAISDLVLKYMMLVLLPVTAILILRGKIVDEERESLPVSRAIVLSCVIAFVMSAYDGFYGPGTGTFLILLLRAIAHFSLRNANGQAKLINLTSNISACVVFLMSGQTIILLGLVAGLFSIAGNYIGTRLFSSRGSKVAKPVMILVLAIFFIKVILDLAGLSL